MAFTTDNVRDIIRVRFQNNAEKIGDADIDLEIIETVRRVNKDFPRQLKRDITGDGTKSYDLGSTFTRISILKEVEFPAGEIPPRILTREDDWIEYEDPSQSAGEQFRLVFLTQTPIASEEIRVTIHEPHTLTNDASTSTVDDQDTFMAIVYKALANLARAKASLYLESIDRVFDADTVDFGAKAQTLLVLAGDWEREYKRVVEAGNEAPVAAQAFAEKDVRFEHGEEFLYHSKTRR